MSRTSDDIWDAFSDFSGDIPDFSLTLDEYNGGTLPESESENSDGEEEIPSPPDTSAVPSVADSVPGVVNPFNEWVAANETWWMPRDLFLALLYRDLVDPEPQGFDPQ